MSILSPLPDASRGLSHEAEIRLAERLARGIARLFDSPPLPRSERRVAVAPATPTLPGGEVDGLAADPEANRRRQQNATIDEPRDVPELRAQRHPDASGPVTIARRKDSPGPPRNVHDAEIVVADHIHRCDVFMPPFGLAFRMNVHGDGHAEHRQTAGCGNRANSGQCRDAFGSLSSESALPMIFGSAPNLRCRVWRARPLAVKNSRGWPD